MTLARVDSLQARAGLYRRIREFFFALDYLEVDTPILGEATATDIHIQSIEAKVNGATGFLQTSPELYMKRLLAGGSGSIYQICHAFRDEESGRRHRPEFSMLEWYAEGFDYRLLMDQVERLINDLTNHKNLFQRMRYDSCFSENLGLELAGASLDDLQRVVGREIAGVDSQSLDYDACLDLLMSEVVAKKFENYTFVYDYPASQAALARVRPGDPPVAERFELFFGDLELANGFTELTDAKEQRRRFEQDNRCRRERGLREYPIDEAFLAALEQHGMPSCAGVALGLDRLLMVVDGAEDIQRVSIA